MTSVRYDEANLVCPARIDAAQSGLLNRVTPESAGWSNLSVDMHRLHKGESVGAESGESEVAIVLLGGTCSIKTSRGDYDHIGRRRNPFEGMPWALYLPRHTSYEVVATSDELEIATCAVPTDRDHEPCLVTPHDATLEIRGGHNNTRQINGIMPPGFPCHRIVCVEVYTPSGNWSSYPPHKHDTHREVDGTLVEADLEEVYCYKFDKPNGWAMQRIYTDDGSIDAAVVARDGDIVLVPEGYHPVSTGYGYHCYYLNFLAGSAQSLACVDDPKHTWVKETWTETDPRVPMVTRAMEGDLQQ